MLIPFKVESSVVEGHDDGIELLMFQGYSLHTAVLAGESTNVGWMVCTDWKLLSEARTEAGIKFKVGGNFRERADWFLDIGHTLGGQATSDGRYVIYV